MSPNYCNAIFLLAISYHDFPGPINFVKVSSSYVYTVCLYGYETFVFPNSTKKEFWLPQAIFVFR